MEYQARMGDAKVIGLSGGRLVVDDGFSVEREARTALELANKFKEVTFKMSFFKNGRHLKLVVKAGEDLDVLIQRTKDEMRAFGVYPTIFFSN